MRIIAGRFRGRPLSAPKGLATRPTTDRVREALFSILGNLENQRVVDCYAGTGALGFEAVSRGAAYALLVENGKEACHVIHGNIERLGVAGQVELLTTPMERSRRVLELKGPFDLVLSDPPWPIAQAAAITVASLFTQALAADGTLVLGHPTREPVELAKEAPFELVDRRHWGDSGLSFFKRKSPPLDAP
jgi:16S rRNA (guanine966-N2)-methyltransferase